jgi:hypothetical protein
MIIVAVSCPGASPPATDMQMKPETKPVMTFKKVIPREMTRQPWSAKFHKLMKSEPQESSAERS